MRLPPSLARLALLAALALASCERRSPAVRPAPLPQPDAAALPAPDAAVAPTALSASEPVDVPAGCELNLSGRYRARDDVSWRYRIEDDGRRLVATREPAEGAGQSPVMVLVRTADGFVGEVRSAARTAGGRSCEVGFAAQIVSCRAGAIVLRSEDELSINESCERLASPREQTEKTLLRD